MTNCCNAIIQSADFFKKEMKRASKTSRCKTSLVEDTRPAQAPEGGAARRDGRNWYGPDRPPTGANRRRLRMGLWQSRVGIPAPGRTENHVPTERKAQRRNPAIGKQSNPCGTSRKEGMNRKRKGKNEKGKLDSRRRFRVPRWVRGLSRQAEGVAKHLHPESVAVGRHRNHVEPCPPAGSVGGFQIMLGALPKLPLFPPIHGRLGRAEPGGTPGLDFHEDQTFAVPGHDVDLAGGGADVPALDSIAESFQMAGGGLFATPAEDLVRVQQNSRTPLKVRRWRGQGPERRIASRWAAVP